MSKENEELLNQDQEKDKPAIAADTSKQDAEEITDAEEVKSDEAQPVLVQLTGMYKDWFLDYASYVILERAVPHVYDGLKPVHEGYR